MLFSILLSSFLLSAEASDTLQTVRVVADKGVIVSKADTISFTNETDITDVLELIPGLYINDYGGIRGLKTASMRGLGTAHTAIYLDGVRIGNVQSGQPDLGMLPMENFGSTVVDYAQNSLSFRTAKPVFNKRPVTGRIRLRGGSFCTYEPDVRIDFRLSDKIMMTTSAYGVFSKGNFGYGDGLRRENNDIGQVRTGIDLWGKINDGDWHAKVFYNSASRGAPGSVTFTSSDRQVDRNIHMQGLLRKRINRVYTLSLSGKAAYDDISYLSEPVDSKYIQKEIQINSSHEFSICDWLKMTAAADLQWDGLNADNYTASRFGTNVVIAGTVITKRVRANISLDYYGIFDKGSKEINSLSPSLGLRFKVFEGFHITAFCRKSHRNPTFNELYFPGFGNPELKAEGALLTDIGVEWHRKVSDKWMLKVKADAFYNFLNDKIASSPTAENPNIWLPYNIGIVESFGSDLQLDLRYSNKDIEAGVMTRYSYQNATDKTPTSGTFGFPIAYVDKNTAILNASGIYKGWKLEAKWSIHSGRRDSYGEMPDWNTFDLKAGKDFHLQKDCVLELFLSLKNLNDCRYEFVSGYPMPGREFMAGLGFRF